MSRIDLITKKIEEAFGVFAPTDAVSLPSEFSAIVDAYAAASTMETDSQKEKYADLLKASLGKTEKFSEIRNAAGETLEVKSYDIPMTENGKKFKAFVQTELKMGYKSGQAMGKILQGSKYFEGTEVLVKMSRVDIGNGEGATRITFQMKPTHYEQKPYEFTEEEQAEIDKQRQMDREEMMAKHGFTEKDLEGEGEDMEDKNYAEQT